MSDEPTNIPVDPPPEPDPPATIPDQRIEHQDPPPEPETQPIIFSVREGEE